MILFSIVFYSVVKRFCIREPRRSFLLKSLSEIHSEDQGSVRRRHLNIMLNNVIMIFTALNNSDTR